MALFSIGHSNHPGPGFLALLAQAGIAVLVDVRSRPASRFCPQFNRRALESALAAAGIEYRFRGAELGGRDPLPDADPRFGSAMRELLALARERDAAMLCSEREPERCHRATRLAAWIHRHEPEARVVHLLPRTGDALERIDSRALEARLSASR
jgi:uncharacterized protein (DUF488 family)